MAFINWVPDFAINIESVDEQHKTLLELLNQLFDSMSAGKSGVMLGSILKELLDYTIYHFNNEEAMFKRFNYPEAPHHMAEHDALTQKVKALQADYEKGSKLVTIEAMYFLKDWLQAHILKEDKKYSPYLISKGIR